MTTELAPDAQFEELVERVLATTIFNEPFVTQLITEAHNARGRVAEAEAERDTARQIASNAIAEAKKLRAEHGRAAALEAAYREARTGRDARDAEIERLTAALDLAREGRDRADRQIRYHLDVARAAERERDHARARLDAVRAIGAALRRIVGDGTRPERDLLDAVDVLIDRALTAPLGPSHEPATATGTPDPDPSEAPAPTGRPRPAQGTAPLTLAQAAGHLHDWARDLADGARTDWPAGHPDIIRGIRAAADWLDARDRYETETREQLRALVDRHGMADRTCLIGDDTSTPDVDGWTIYPTTDGGLMVSHDTDADRPTLGALDSIPLAAVLAFIADADEETPEPGERTE